ncbi:H-2 class II histocompatibility antigen, A-U beta chain-like isoform X3 [Megalobrama amblycephala]|uniref:H-2 class II histocompatibility antigen, A-U beta chain-like isoform X3 n=1 Tax=Megalobrama amblycephala TaxID=75352 RepID=UPI0020141F15|nr:H-2 class II histocompatibility antigen, A-U beta chain-like isoform X3 [Megalobrama amblycephala]
MRYDIVTHLVLLHVLFETVKPEVIIRSVRQASGKSPAMLICSAYDFYPKPIKLTWMRDDKEMTADVTSTEELADGDWYYQIHSHLEYFPKPGEKISCVVEHASSHRPMIYHWDSSLSESDRNKMITGAAGVVLGVIMAAGGLICYKRKHTVQGNYGYLHVLCRVPDTQQNTEFIFSVNYNMIKYLRYNSTENKAVGFTEFGEKLAEEYNNNTLLPAHQEFVLDRCKKIGDVILNLGLTAPPEVIIRLDREANGNQKAVLVCSAYDFYPKPIKLTWMRDDKEVTADVTSTEELDDGDWYYQIHSHLEYFPKPGEKISCVVEHASFHRPMVYHWDPSLSESERSKIILGAVGLVMGVVMAAGGLIYHKRKQTGFYRLPVCLLPLQTMDGDEQQ